MSFCVFFFFYEKLLVFEFSYQFLCFIQIYLEKQLSVIYYCKILFDVLVPICYCRLRQF